MRIIISSKSPQNEEIVACHNCKSVIGYLPEDVVFNDATGWPVIHCPVDDCGKNILIPVPSEKKF